MREWILVLIRSSSVGCLQPKSLLVLPRECRVDRGSHCMEGSGLTITAVIREEDVRVRRTGEVVSLFELLLSLKFIIGM